MLADGPLAYWRLGEAAGPTVTDLTGNGHDGTADPGVAFGQAGSLVLADLGLAGVDLLLADILGLVVVFLAARAAVRQLPDKAVSLLDTASARVAIGHSAVPPAIGGLIEEFA